MGYEHSRKGKWSGGCDVPACFQTSCVSSIDTSSPLSRRADSSGTTSASPSLLCTILFPLRLSTHRQTNVRKMQARRRPSVTSRISFALSTASNVERGEPIDGPAVAAAQQIEEEIAEIKRYEVWSGPLQRCWTVLHTDNMGGRRILPP